MKNIEPRKRGSEDAKAWATERVRGIGKEVGRLRATLGLSAVQLAQRTVEVGYPITRGTIAKIENGHRGGSLDIAEVVALAAALEVTPLELLFPGLPSEPITYLPAEEPQMAVLCLQRFTGEAAMPQLWGGMGSYDLDQEDGLKSMIKDLETASKHLRASAHRVDLSREWQSWETQRNDVSARKAQAEYQADIEEAKRLGTELRIIEDNMKSLRQNMTAAGLDVPSDENG